CGRADSQRRVRRARLCPRAWRRDWQGCAAGRSTGAGMGRRADRIPGLAAYRRRHLGAGRARTSEAARHASRFDRPGRVKRTAAPGGHHHRTHWRCHPDAGRARRHVARGGDAAGQDQRPRSGMARSGRTRGASGPCRCRQHGEHRTGGVSRSQAGRQGHCGATGCQHRKPHPARAGRAAQSGRPSQSGHVRADQSELEPGHASLAGAERSRHSHGHAQHGAAGSGWGPLSAGRDHAGTGNGRQGGSARWPERRAKRRC
ncbi:hypothetical protein KXX48_009014, partial [Aspergillus fumigatus]